MKKGMLSLRGAEATKQSPRCIWIASLSLAMTFIMVSLPVGATPSYRKLLRHNTRHDRVYELKNFEPRIVWHVTHLTRGLVEAQIEHLDHQLHFSAAEKADELKTRMAPVEKGDAFFISFFTKDRTSNNLARTNVPWKVELSRGGQHDADWIRPISTEKIRAGGFERFLYPYVDLWSDTFIVIFPYSRAGEDARTVNLRILGLGGSSTLTFD